MLKTLSTWSRVLHFICSRVVFSFYDRGRVVLAAVSADSAGGVLGQSNTGGEPASYKCCNSLRKAAARNTEKRSEQKRKRTMLDQRPESVWPGVVCWPF